MADADRCVMCGAIIPEGRMICPTCEREVKPAFRGAKLPPSLKGMQVDKELAKAEMGNMAISNRVLGGRNEKIRVHR